MKALVLAEKPSVGREIARVLGCRQNKNSYIEGPRYVVTWALGHLVELAEPEDYDKKYSTWRLEDLPLMPKYMKLKVIRQSSRQFKTIASLAKRKDIDKLIIATDAGREGELVARWIMKLISWKKPYKRLWISSQTDQAIKEGFANLKPGPNYDSLYRSAVCRAEADWLIGLNVTRALACKFNAQLSAGRVQTPTLAALMERERQIRNFQPTDYWTVAVNFGKFHGMWRDENGNRLNSSSRAEEIKKEVENQQGIVSKVKSNKRTQPTPLPYDLTELQRDANRILGFSAKHTSSVLQRLYEQHKLVTYPRTDSRHLSSDMASTLPKRLKAMAVGPYTQLIHSFPANPRLAKGVINDSKVTDHHAIIPTDESLQLPALTSDETKLYDLVARRFIALFLPPHRYRDIQVTLEIAGHKFTARGKIREEAGWRRAYDKSIDRDDTSPQDDQEQLLPELTQGQKIKANRCTINKRQTQPPARYSEATLLTVMEKNNLGTPATRADIIEKLLQTDTIQRKGNQLRPTKKGEQLLELVPQDLRSPELTAKWEYQLEKIACNQADHRSFDEKIRQHAIKLVNEVKKSEKTYQPHNAVRARCPNCGQFLRRFKGKRGEFLACPDRSCGYRISAGKQLSNRRCPQCHKKMELRTGKAGKFFHCRQCNVVEKLEQGDRRQDRRKQRQLVKNYQKNDSLTASLGDALKEALKEKK